jgi:hypothetical protein
VQGGRVISAILARFPWLSWAVAGVALAIAGVQTVRLSWLQTEVAENKAAQAGAILKLEQKAERLSNELVIEQAKAMAVTAQKETVYVDRIKRIPMAQGEDEAARSERMRAGTAGVRDLLCGGATPQPWCSVAPR